MDGERLFMQLYSAANLVLNKLCAILCSSIYICLLSTLYFTSVHANSQVTSQNLYSPSDEVQATIHYALSNSSLALKDEVAELYSLQNHKLIWSNSKHYNKNAQELFNFIKNAYKLGLDPDHYDIDVIEYFLESTIDDENILTKSDVTFTHAFIKIASHLHKGKLAGESSIKSEAYSLIDILNEAINNNSIISSLENLQPTHNRYKKLVEVLQRFQSIEDGLDVIKLHKKSLTIGDSSPEIIKVRNRLYAFGDYVGNNLTNEVLDEPIAIAITNFQRRHGLKADGLLGKKTVNELNKPIAYRIQQIESNLDRMRQLPNSNDKRYLTVNIPEYKLYLIDNGKKVYQSRVVVGKRKNKTPVISSELTELVLSPYWHVPKSIASKEIIPLIQQDPEYLNKNNIKLLSNFNNETQIVNPETVDWNNIDLTNAPLRFRQDPGSKNSLGRIKFIFPNNYNVYLHDTPSRRLFAQNQRAFSHGCIRVEDPFGLAEVLLAEQDNWSKNDLDHLANRKRPKALKLVNPVPIHITYMTAWVDEQDVIHFRPDIYKQDRKFANTLYNVAQ